MNVKELMEILGEYPQDMRVVVQGYEDGYDDVRSGCVKQRKVKLNAGKEDWVGDHMDFNPEYDRQEDGDVVETVVAVRRPGR